VSGNGPQFRSPFLEKMPLASGRTRASECARRYRGGKDVVSTPETVRAGSIQLASTRTTIRNVDGRDDDEIDKNPNAIFTFWEADSTPWKTDRRLGDRRA